MGEVAAEATIDASLKEVWEAFFNENSWAAWVDGFDRIVSCSEGYPGPSGKLRWRSIPTGRGEVSEQVLDHEPRRHHRISFADPESEGELSTTFEIRGEGVVVSRRMAYTVLHPGLLGPLTDVFFVRRQVAAALTRELAGLKYELEANL
ncbi:MAG: SRPBCC family protein [Solirubrobacterales bacterium]